MRTSAPFQRSPSSPGRAARYLAILAVLLGTMALGACGSSGGGRVDYDDDFWRHDDRYRSRIYDHHHDADVDVNLPDRPRSRVTRSSRGGRRGGGGHRGGRGGRR